MNQAMRTSVQHLALSLAFGEFQDAPQEGVPQGPCSQFPASSGAWPWGAAAGGCSGTGLCRATATEPVSTRPERAGQGLGVSSSDVPRVS